MELSVQVFTGSCLKGVSDWQANAIIDKLNRIYAATDIANAFIGWHADADIGGIMDVLKKHGTAVYLWLPVFSELDECTENLPVSFMPLIGADGRVCDGTAGEAENERFRFCCPSEGRNLKLVCDMAEANYRLDDFDGVFLDKIRFPSFANGLHSVTGCFCEACMAKHKTHGLRDYIHDYQAKDPHNPLDITAYRDMRMTFGDERIHSFFAYKADAVYDAMKELSAYFKGRGLAVGFDLFAPFLSAFVGQDYHKLLPLADLVKPMFYRRTNAPAGLPYEIEQYASAFAADATAKQAMVQRFSDIIGGDFGSMQWINRETAAIRKCIDDNGLKTRLHAGVELNYNEKIAPITKEYVSENILSMKHVDGLVMSWDLHSTPVDMIDHMLGIIERVS